MQESDAEAAAATDRALEEGRVDGKYRCSWCGMRSHLESEARDCCRELGPPATSRVANARFGR